MANISAKNLKKIVGSKSYNKQNKNLPFFKKTFPYIVPLGVFFHSFDTPNNFFLAFVPKTLILINAAEGFTSLLSKILPWKCFYRQVECSFGKLAKIFPVTIEVCIVKVQKPWKNNC